MSESKPSRDLIPAGSTVVSIYCGGVEGYPEHNADRWLYGSFLLTPRRWLQVPDVYVSAERESLKIRADRGSTLLDDAWHPLSPTGLIHHTDLAKQARNDYRFRPCPKCGFAKMVKWRADNLETALDALKESQKVVEVPIHLLWATHYRATRRANRLGN